MKKITTFFVGVIYGIIFTSIMAYIFAERIAAAKQRINEGLAQRPGLSNDELYNKWFLEYFVYRHLTDTAAWKEVQRDYPDFLPKNVGPDNKIEINKAEKNFREAMKIRRNKISTG
ncbi:MAG: hypothetical protein ABSB41_19820 [Anaerolineales bacterium]|jgi:hypothetical protein